MTDSVDITPLEPSTTWIVFVLAALLHSFTFLFLENMSNHFKDYINLCKGSDRKRHSDEVYDDGHVLREQTSVVQMVPPQQLPPSATVSRFWKLNENSFTHQLTHTAHSHPNAAYTPLHDTLDVSVFR
jgi:hypothetical protein